MTPVTPVAARTVVGLGASAGGLEPVCSIVAGLPADLPAAVLVLVHLSPAAPSVLDRILARCGPLPVTFGQDGTPLEVGHIYVAPADEHLVVTDGHLALDHGPTVNAVRPSVDVLFRSMALAYGSHCVGVILSGTRDDGAAGLLDIRRADGVTIVQDPSDAAFPGMPTAACNMSEPDAVAPADKIAGLITQAAVRLASDDLAVATKGGTDAPSTASASSSHPEGNPSELACPECGGVLWEQTEPHYRFQCRIGHSYSPDSLVVRHSQKVEEALWSAVVALEERADLLTRVGQRLSSGRSASRVLRRYEAGVKAARANAQALRQLVLDLERPPSPAE